MAYFLLWMYMMGTPGIFRMRCFNSLSHVATMKHLCYDCDGWSVNGALNDDSNFLPHTEDSNHISIVLPAWHDDKYNHPHRFLYGHKVNAQSEDLWQSSRLPDTLCQTFPAQPRHNPSRTECTWHRGNLSWLWVFLVCFGCWNWWNLCQVERDMEARATYCNWKRAMKQPADCRWRDMSKFV